MGDTERDSTRAKAAAPITPTDREVSTAADDQPREGPSMRA